MLFWRRKVASTLIDSRDRPDAGGMPESVSGLWREARGLPFWLAGDVEDHLHDDALASAR